LFTKRRKTSYMYAMSKADRAVHVMNHGHDLLEP
jgi:hypothetical protein